MRAQRCHSGAVSLPMVAALVDPPMDFSFFPRVVEVWDESKVSWKHCCRSSRERGDSAARVGVPVMPLQDEK